MKAKAIKNIISVAFITQFSLRSLNQSTRLDFLPMQIECLGFCAYVLAESKILLPSVPEMGTVLWKQKIYGFYSIDSAEFFIAKPSK